MVELLVKATDVTHQNEVKDLRGCYKKGYVVVAKPSPCKWGKEELNKQKFYILRIKDVEIKDVRHLVQPHEISLGTRYTALSDKLGVFVSSSDRDAAQKECLEKCRLAAQELTHFGINISEEDYDIRIEEEPEIYTVARRRYRVDIGKIENDLKKGIVEMSAKDLKIIDQRQ